MNEVRPSSESGEKINDALGACFLALKTWQKLLPALAGSPDEFEASLVMAELYSKCGRIFFYGFMHDAKWHAAIDFADLALDDKKKAFEWIVMRHR